MDLIERLMSLNPNDRPSLSAVRSHSFFTDQDQNHMQEGQDDCEPSMIKQNPDNSFASDDDGNLLDINIQEIDIEDNRQVPQTQRMSFVDKESSGSPSKFETTEFLPSVNMGSVMQTKGNSFI